MSSQHSAADSASTASHVLISRALSVRGDVISDGDVVILGKVIGNVEALSARVSVGVGGSVVGNIKAHHVIIAGHVEGTVVASLGIEVHPNASVEGEMQAPKVHLQVRPSAVATTSSHAAPAHAQAHAHAHAHAATTTTTKTEIETATIAFVVEDAPISAQAIQEKPAAPVRTASQTPTQPPMPQGLPQKNNRRPISLRGASA